MLGLDEIGHVADLVEPERALAPEEVLRHLGVCFGAIECCAVNTKRNVLTLEEVLHDVEVERLALVTAVDEEGDREDGLGESSREAGVAEVEVRVAGDGVLEPVEAVLAGRGEVVLAATELLGRLFDLKAAGSISSL